MIIMLNIFFWVILTLFGTLLVLPLTNHLTELERVGLGLLIGAGIHSILYFITLKFSDSVFPSYYLFPIELTISFILSRLPATVSSKPVFHLKKENMLISLLGVIVGIMILGYTSLQSIFWPVYEPDAIHLYDYRAQRLLLNDKTVLFDSLPYEHNNQYPPFTSLFHLFSYQNGLTNPKVLYPTIYITWYICLLGYLLRTTRSPILSIWGANIIIASPNIWWQSFQAMTNVPYMIYLSLGGIYLVEGNNRSMKIILPALLTAIATSIRLEPLWVSGLLLLIVSTIKNKNIFPLVTWSIIFYILSIPWRHFGPQNDTLSQQVVGEIRQLTATTTIKQLSQSIPIAISFFTNYYLPTSILFIVGTISSVMRHKSISDMQIYGFFTISTLLLGIINVYCRDPHWYEYTDSIRRMMIIMIPIILIGFIQESSKVTDQL